MAYSLFVVRKIRFLALLLCTLTYVKILIIIKISGFFFRKWYKKDTAYQKKITNEISEPNKARCFFLFTYEVTLVRQCKTKNVFCFALFSLIRTFVPQTKTV